MLPEHGLAASWHLTRYKPVQPQRGDPALVKTLARANRWRSMLESGEHGTVRELAKAERVKETYISRTLQLTLLAPEMVAAILDGRQGATIDSCDIIERIEVSIHAPVRGRHGAAWRRSGAAGFDPRPREGATCADRRGIGLLKVSIHAPVRGRRSTAWCSTSHCGFDPRPREGATTCGPASSAPLAVSIHAPVRGRRAGAAPAHPAAEVSIHAPVRGRPPPAPAAPCDSVVSIHAPVRGRPVGFNLPPSIAQFRSTPP